MEQLPISPICIVKNYIQKTRTQIRRSRITSLTLTQGFLKPAMQPGIPSTAEDIRISTQIGSQ